MFLVPRFSVRCLLAIIGLGLATVSGFTQSVVAGGHRSEITLDQSPQILALSCSRSSEPVEGRPVVPLDTEIDAPVLAEFPYYRDCPQSDDPGVLRYLTGSTDLDGDGVSELVVFLLGRDACGTGGCTALIFARRDTGYRLLSRLTTVSLPILAAASRTNGWRDLLIQVAGGGMESALHMLRFDGVEYPGNASMAPTVRDTTSRVGATVIIGESSQGDRGRLLVPVECREISIRVGNSITSTERVGNLSIGARAEEVEHELGQPTSMGELHLWGADGRYHQQWEHADRGVSINMGADAVDAEFSVYSILLTAPATLRTARGIGIGSTLDEVQAAYAGAGGVGSERVGVEPIIVGTEYDGLQIQFDDQGIVRSIFLGASAE